MQRVFKGVAETATDWGCTKMLKTCLKIIVIEEYFLQSGTVVINIIMLIKNQKIFETIFMNEFKCRCNRFSAELAFKIANPVMPLL